jgi:hypothetical protein
VVKTEHSGFAQTGNKFTQGVVYKLKPGVPGDIAAYRCAVRSHRFGGDFERGDLTAHELFEAFFHQIDAALVFVFANAPSQQIIRV